MKELLENTEGKPGQKTISCEKIYCMVVSKRDFPNCECQNQTGTEIEISE